MKRERLSEDYVNSDSDYESSSQGNEDSTKESTSRPIKSKKVSSSTLNSDGEPTFELSDKRRVTVRKFRSSVLIDIREFYEDKSSGKDCPGKKGISLTKDQFEKLKELIPEIDEALKNLK